MQILTYKSRIAAPASTAIALMFALLSGCTNAPTITAPAVAADTVFTNGKVITVDARASVAQAFAVKDG